MHVAQSAAAMLQANARECISRSMIADVDVRLAILSDAAEIAAMSRDYIERGLPWTWTEARVAHCIRDRDTNVVVAREKGIITGFGIMFHATDDAHLLLFAVRR